MSDKQVKPMTPDQFAEKMREIAESGRYDQESGHMAGDRLMCDLLEALGYKLGVEWFESFSKWYS